MQYAQIRLFVMALAVAVLLLFQNVLAWGQASPPTYDLDGRPIKCSQKGPLDNALKDLDDQIAKLNAAKYRRTTQLGPAREERDKAKAQYDQTHSPADWDKWDAAQKKVEALEQQIKDIDRQLALLNGRKQDASNSFGKNCGCQRGQVWCPNESRCVPGNYFDCNHCGCGQTR
jgi:hypothetical protein